MEVSQGYPASDKNGGWIQNGTEDGSEKGSAFVTVYQKRGVTIN